jgi:hypothetical protein
MMPGRMAGLAADLDVIHRHGWIDKQQLDGANTNLKTATSDQLRQSASYLTQHYFDQDAGLSESVRWINYYRQFEADVRAGLAGGSFEKQDAARALKWARGDVSVGDLKDAIDWIRTPGHYKPPKGGWPTVPQLALPRMR